MTERRPAPIGFADIRKGDRIRATSNDQRGVKVTYEGVAHREGEDYWLTEEGRMVVLSTWPVELLDRPQPPLPTADHAVIADIVTTTGVELSAGYRVVPDDTTDTMLWLLVGARGRTFWSDGSEIESFRVVRDA